MHNGLDFVWDLAVQNLGVGKMEGGRGPGLRATGDNGTKKSPRVAYMCEGLQRATGRVS